MEHTANEQILYGDLTARIRRMLEPVAHDSFLFFETTTRLLQEQVRPGSKVLDAGCGRGTVTAWLAERGCHVVAIDSSTERVQQTQQLLAEKQLEDHVHVEISRLPDAFPEDHFDVILDCFSWWHISDWPRLLNLSRKNLVPRGRLVIFDTFFGWKTTLDFRRKMREDWETALPTFNESKNMMIKRDFRMLHSDSLQEEYLNYVNSIRQKIHEFEKEDLGSFNPSQIEDVKQMWDWFADAAAKEELVATYFVAELTQS